MTASAHLTQKGLYSLTQYWQDLFLTCIWYLTTSFRNSSHDKGSKSSQIIERTAEFECLYYDLYNSQLEWFVLCYILSDSTDNGRGIHYICCLTGKLYKGFMGIFLIHTVRFLFLLVFGFFWLIKFFFWGGGLFFPK